MSKGKILVADDTATYRAMIGDALVERGYDVIYAADGLQTVQMAREEMKGLMMIVLDLLMPKMLGFEALREIRQMKGGEDLPVMVITGLFKSIDDIKKVKNLGASGFIDKALPMEEVIYRIDNFLNPEEQFSHDAPLATASILVNYKVDSQPFSAYSYTVSENGLFLRTTEAHSADTEVIMRFRLEEEGAAIEAKGKIAYLVTTDDREAMLKSPQGIGVEFTEISNEDKAALGRWVEKILKEKEMAGAELEEES